MSETTEYLGILKCNEVPIDHDLMLKRKEEAEAEMERIRQEIAFIIGDVNIGSNCSTKKISFPGFGSAGAEGYGSKQRSCG